MLGLSPGTILPAADPRVVRLWRLRLIVQALARATGAEWVGLYRKVRRGGASSGALHAGAAKSSAAGAVSSTASDGPDGGDEGASLVLVKEAYVGSNSRPFFPLTEAFAAKSNNSTVAMTRKTIVYHHVDAVHLEDEDKAADGDKAGDHAKAEGAEGAGAADAVGDSNPYYVCDTRVQFELCAPIVDSKTGEVLGILDVEAWRPRHLARDGVLLALQVCQRLGEMGAHFAGDAH